MVLLIAKNFQLVKFSQVDLLKIYAPAFVQTDRGEAKRVTVTPL